VLQQIASSRGVSFIPGIELSPSWGHFNAYPLARRRAAGDRHRHGHHRHDPEGARRNGATVVQVNHPFNPYGYFASLKAAWHPAASIRV